MATISENLQTIKNSTDAIKQAIIDKGVDVSGDITTWANAISGLSGGGSSVDEEYVFTGTCSYNRSIVTITGSLNKFPDTGRNYLLALGWYTGGLCYASHVIGSTDSYTLTVDFDEPIESIEGKVPVAICILNIMVYNHTVIPVKFRVDISTNPT